MSVVAEHRIEVAFDDNRLLPMLYGEHDRHLSRIEHQLGISLASRGNQISIRGPREQSEQALLVLNTLWAKLEQGASIDEADVDATIGMVGDPTLENFSDAKPTKKSKKTGEKKKSRQKTDDQKVEERASAMRRVAAPDRVIKTRLRSIAPRSVTQAHYMEELGRNDLVFGLGPAGTGKTYLAVAQAVAMLSSGEVDRIILSRPAVEAGERLGFLPGDLKEKVDPYLRPLYDALYDMLPGEQVTRHIEAGTIEIAPLAFMRGRTLANAFVILDEAQNTTVVQMRMFLTRLGEHSRMVVTGDLSQIDLPPSIQSGLSEAVAILQSVESVAQIRFTRRDVVRHPLVTRIVGAYEKLDEARRANETSPSGRSARG